VDGAATAMADARSPSGAPSEVGASPISPVAPGDPCEYPANRAIKVATVATLRAALRAAMPGDRLELAAGLYAGRFELLASGTPALPIVLCGARGAILDGGSTSTGYVLHVRGSHVVVSGFTVRNGLKGVMLDGASSVWLSALEVHQIGEEAIHLRAGSSRCVVRACLIREAGLVNPQFGEGIYVGSAENHWAEFGKGGPDRCDGNELLGNTIRDTAAEPIDIKEGTTGGRVAGNHLEGAKLSGLNGADSWMDVKGNGWLIEDNVGTGSLRHGFEVHQAVVGWGNDNVFRGNQAQVDAPGYGFFIEKGTTGNAVMCDNVVSGAVMGFGNVACRK
jgi:hypothetical protein